MYGLHMDWGRQGASLVVPAAAWVGAVGRACEWWHCTTLTHDIFEYLIAFSKSTSQSIALCKESKGEP